MNKKLTFSEFVQIFAAYRDYINDGGKPEERPEIKPEERPEIKPEERPEIKPDERDAKISELEKKIAALEARQTWIDVDQIKPEGIDDVVRKMI